MKKFARVLMLVASLLPAMKDVACASQSFSPLPTTTPPGLSGVGLATTVNQNEAALQSSFSGATVPAAPVAGQLFYNTSSPGLSYFDGTAWNSLGLPTITLGTSAANTNPSRSGQITTGILSPASNEVSIALGGTQEFNFFSGGLAIGVSSLTAGTVLDMGSATNSFLLPKGSTAQRPGTPAVGMFRYNSTNHVVEAYQGVGEWQPITKTAINFMEYGGVCDGSTSDNSALTAAGSLGAVVWIPPTSTGCALNGFQPASGLFIAGMTTPWYDPTSGTRSFFVPTSGATSIFDMTANPKGITIEHVDIFGGGFSSTVMCITGGSTQLFLLEDSIRYCGNGGLGDSSHITHLAQSTNTFYYGNGGHNSTAGINNTVDSHFANDSVTSNYYGIYQPTGANANVYDGVRIEWSTHFGALMYQSDLNVFNGVQLDSNADGAMSINGATRVTINGGWGYRNGSSNAYGTNNTFYFDGNWDNIAINGFVTKHGHDDGGGGIDRPAYSITFNTAGLSNAGHLSINGGDMTGYVTGPLVYTATSTELIYRGVTGLPDVTTDNTHISVIGAAIAQSGDTSPIQITGSVNAGIYNALYLQQTGGGTGNAVCMELGTYNTRTASAPASVCGYDDNFSGDIVFRNKATGSSSGSDVGTANFNYTGACVLNMPCLLGILTGANFNSTADQAITVRPLTANGPGYLSAATKYFITEIDIDNCSASPGTAAGGFYTAASKGGTIIGTTIETFTNCTSATTRQRFTGITNMDTTVLSAATLYFALTTAKGSSGTGDIRIYGIPYK